MPCLSKVMSRYNIFGLFETLTSTQPFGYYRGIHYGMEDWYIFEICLIALPENKLKPFPTI